MEDSKALTFQFEIVRNVCFAYQKADMVKKKIDKSPVCIDWWARRDGLLH